MVSARKIIVVLLLAVAVPATAQTFGFSFTAPARNVCVSIEGATWWLAGATGYSDYTVRFDPAAPAPDVRINLATTPDEADFVLVDDGETPANCAARAGARTKSVKVSADAPAPDLVVGLAAPTDANYRIYVRSERISPEAAAALFAVARKLPGHAVAGR